MKNWVIGCLLLVGVCGCTLDDTAFGDITAVKELPNRGYLVDIECRKPLKFSYSSCTFYTEVGLIWTRTDAHMHLGFYEERELHDIFMQHMSRYKYKNRRASDED